VLDSVAQGKKTVPEAMTEVCKNINEALTAEVEKVKAYSG
jgi:hypothetical protein